MSDPVIVLIQAKVRPEMRETFIEAVKAGREESLREEGCLAYSVNENLVEPGHFTVVEEWRDRATLEAHVKTAHAATLLAAAGPCLAEPPRLEAIDGGTRWQHV